MSNPDFGKSPDFGAAKNIVKKSKGSSTPDFGGVVGVTERDKVYSDFAGYMGEVLYFPNSMGSSQKRVGGQLGASQKKVGGQLGEVLKFRTGGKLSMDGLPIAEGNAYSMDGLLDDPWGAVQDIFSSTLNKAKDEALATATTQLVTDPTVQSALEQKAKEGVVQQLAQSLLTGATTAQDFVSKNKTLVIGGTIVATLGLGYLLFGRKRK